MYWRRSTGLFSYISAELLRLLGVEGRAGSHFDRFDVVALSLVGDGRPTRHAINWLSQRLDGLRQKMLEAQRATETYRLSGTTPRASVINSIFLRHKIEYGAFKHERVYRRHYRTRDDANADMLDSIERFYN